MKLRNSLGKKIPLVRVSFVALKTNQHEIDAFIQPILRTVRHDKDKAAQLVRLDDRQFLEYISKLVYLKAFKDLHPNNVLKQWIGQPDILKKLR